MRREHIRETLSDGGAGITFPERPVGSLHGRRPGPILCWIAAGGVAAGGFPGNVQRMNKAETGWRGKGLLLAVAALLVLAGLTLPVAPASAATGLAGDPPQSLHLHHVAPQGSTETGLHDPAAPERGTACHDEAGPCCGSSCHAGTLAAVAFASRPCPRPPGIAFLDGLRGSTLTPPERPPRT